MKYTIILHDPPKIMEVKTQINTSSVKHPATSRVDQPYLKCIYMIEKNADSRNVIYSVTNTANMVGWPLILRVGFRSMIRRYDGVVFHNLYTWKM